MGFFWVSVALTLLMTGAFANPDAKRLYDDLMSSYNSMIRPVVNNSDHVTVKIGLKLSQLIDVVRRNLFVLRKNEGYGNDFETEPEGPVHGDQYDGRT